MHSLNQIAAFFAVIATVILLLVLLGHLTCGGDGRPPIIDNAAEELDEAADAI